MENECRWYDPSCALAWLANEIKLLFLWLLDGIFSGVAGIYAAIPAPSFLLDVEPVVVPPGVAWAVDMFQVSVGFSILVSAYIVRFLIRRIPFVG